MLNLRLLACVIFVSLTPIAQGASSAQTYPNKPVRIVVAEPGGGNDFVARLIAQGISGDLGQNLIVENRPTSRFVEIVAKAPPDGYTLVVTGASIWILPLLQHTPYEVRDFSPVTILGRSPNVLVVHPSLPVKSVKELLSYAKNNVGGLNYASGGAGTTSHLAAELFKAMAGGVNLVHVSYRGTGPAVNALIGGEVQLMFPNLSASAPHLKSGKLKALAVTTAEPTALAPALPTVSTSGLPGYESVGMTVMFAPAKTPGYAIARLNQEIVRFLKTPEARERFFNSGLDSVGSSPGGLAAAMKSDIARMGKVIKDANIRVD